MLPNRFPTLFLFLCSLTLLSYGGWRFFNPQVIIQWSTASEVDTLGFSIYRAEDPGGPFTYIVNEELIPAEGELVSGADYQTLDRNVISGTTYYYQLHEIQIDGEKETFGPITITAKRSGLLEIILSLILIPGILSTMKINIPRKTEEN
ncbi:MAG: hypothetical protein CVU46_00105 [Chloroflexi bacterium HGW-Chloroflexi-8]|nr:MAG: hypothetical protein CVU46_00105 [Chloroflexi bacterium HGW-Chloroflexi-8]